MPGFDGTGPMGHGAMTERGIGYCSPYIPYNPRGFRRNFNYGFRRGFGRGFRACWNPVMNRLWGNYYGYEPTENDFKAEIEALKADREMIDKMIGDIENRLTGEKNQ